MRYSLWKQPLLSVVHSHIVAYPTGSNLNFSWNYGSLAGVVLVIQIATGVFLAMHYCCHVDMSFASVQHIMVDVPFGWLLRYTHANGASLFFIVVYIHIFRAIYYSSYASPREAVWLIGVVILLVMIVTAFIGYVLPFGQLSMWGSTVITSLASAIPVVGDSITTWLWGGFTVANPTLNRFYSLHFLLPFILAALSIVHLAALHQYGSTNPIGVNVSVDTIPFYPYYSSKDLIGVVVLGIFLSILVFYYPDLLSHPDNQIPANPYSTPAHIVPEWYFCAPIYSRDTLLLIIATCTPCVFCDATDRARPHQAGVNCRKSLIFDHHHPHGYGSLCERHRRSLQALPMSSASQPVRAIVECK